MIFLNLLVKQSLLVIFIASIGNMDNFAYIEIVFSLLSDGIAKNPGAYHVLQQVIDKMLDMAKNWIKYHLGFLSKN